MEDWRSIRDAVVNGIRSWEEFDAFVKDHCRSCRICRIGFEVERAQHEAERINNSDLKPFSSYDDTIDKTVGAWLLATIASYHRDYEELEAGE